ncbi:MAG: serine/threonine-protein kinase [Gemmatimonadota bacterium]
MSVEKICPTCGTEYPANERFCPRDGTALRSQGGESNDLVGSIIAERYHVLKKLGEGGMGQVYLAEHVKMGRKSAVKVMNPGMVHDADAISRFNREAANASRINHPNVAGIYDFGETPDGLIYLAMEFIEGQSLTALVESAGALPPTRAADITKQAADGLAVAHDMGIVHRDLKPDNIMIAKNRDGSDCVKVVDFGIAKAAGAENQKVTKTGLVVGTPEYMSPEQLAGDKLDGRSDIYSLALVAFNMFTGKLPFPSESAQESMIMRLTDEPKSLQEMKPDRSWSAEVQSVMRKALQRRREDRYGKASDFGTDLLVAVERMPKQAPAATQMVGAIDGATAVMSAPPPTRIDASASAAPAPAPVAPVAPPPAYAPPAAPAKSSTGLYVGVGVAAVAIAFVAYTQMGKKDAPPGTDTSKAATPVTATAPPATQTPSGASNTGNRGNTGGQGSGNPGTKAAGAVNPPAGTTGPIVAVSYDADLLSLSNSIINDVTAQAALKKLADYEAKVTLPADKAAMAFVEAKATMIAVGAEKGCRLLRVLRANDLHGELKSDFTEALQSCGTP